jgi:hypothetical protein
MRLIVSIIQAAKRFYRAIIDAVIEDVFPLVIIGIVVFFLARKLLVRSKR